MSRGTATPFAELAETCERLAATRKRTEKRTLIATFLRRLNPDEIPSATLLIVGTIFPEQDSKPLDVGYQLLSRLAARPRRPRLLNLPLTILDVRDSFEIVARTSGKSSVRRKEELLESLMSRASDVERKWLMKSIFGEMQHGVGEGLMLEAIAEAGAIDISAVRRTHMFLGDLGETARLALAGDRTGFESVGLTLLRPVKPMLAEMAHSVEEVFREIRPPVAFEFKFDGARVQIHKSADQVRIFSRRLSDVTESIPEVALLVREELRAKTAVLDGEVVAVSNEGKPLPFQDLMRRFRRIREVNEAQEKVPVKLYLFDVLYNDDGLLIDKPYSERWKALSRMRGGIEAAPRLVTSSVDDALDFMRRSLQAGHEGLMAKALEGPYRPGSRGKLWLKVKSATTLDLVIVAADWGYGRRRGWLSDYYLAAADEETGKLEVVGKTFKGLTDAEFEWMTKKLQELKVSEDEHTVYVKPAVVVEVAFGEVQRSSKYKSGVALRFARITRIREDKSPDQVDTLGALRAILKSQFRSKGMLKG